jgi:carboxymethylenebutenolidase
MHLSVNTVFNFPILSLRYNRWTVETSRRRLSVAIKGEWISYGQGSGYFARPEKAALPLPGVLVIQEVGGVNDNIMDLTRRIAAAGYAALAPDLFAVDGTRPEKLTKERISEAFAFAGRLPPGTMFDPAGRAAALATLPEAEARKISESFAEIFSYAAPGRTELLVPPLVLAYRHLREERPETRGQRVGCVGFCMGGSLSALLACEESQLSGAAVFYGNAPPPEKIPAIGCPVIAFYGAKDQRVNAGIPAFEGAMKAAGKSMEHHIYEGAGHAFMNDDAPSYDVSAARDAWLRLLGFFAEHLAG